MQQKHINRIYYLQRLVKFSFFARFFLFLKKIYPARIDLLSYNYSSVFSIFSSVGSDSAVSFPSKFSVLSVSTLSL